MIPSRSTATTKCKDPLSRLASSSYSLESFFSFVDLQIMSLDTKIDSASSLQRYYLQSTSSLHDKEACYSLESLILPSVWILQQREMRTTLLPTDCLQCNTKWSQQPLTKSRSQLHLLLCGDSHERHQLRRDYTRRTCWHVLYYQYVLARVAAQVLPALSKQSPSHEI